MGIGGVAAGIGAAASVASAANSIANSGGGGGGGYYGGASMPPSYIPQQQPYADQQYINYLNQLSGYASQGSPYVSNIQNNPYAGGAQTAANQAGKYGVGTLAPMQEGAAAGLYGAGQGILNTAFDPQQALYNRTQQQVMDQANAVNAMSGLSGSPYGAGVAGHTLSNFNIDWQNNLLQRQLQGVQGAGQAYAGASDLGGSAINTLNTAGTLPYNTYMGQQSDALNALSAGQGLDANTLNALAAYLKLGQSATAVGQQGSQIGFGQQQQLGQGLGQALSGLSGPLSTLFGGGGNTAAGLGSGGYGYISQPSYYDPSYFDSSANANYGNAGY
jgi:hypothetical protein